MLEVQMIDLRLIDQLPGNVRRRNTKKDVAGLAENIKLMAAEAGTPDKPEAGLLSPIMLRPSAAKKGRYENVAGSRRFNAMALLKASTIPAFVRELTDRQAVEISATENLQRDDLHPIEEGDAYKHMLEAGMTIAEVVETAGRSESHIYKRLKLNDLEPSISKAFWEGTAPEFVTPPFFIEIAKLPTHEGQLKMYDMLKRSPGYNTPSLGDFKGWIRHNFSRDLKRAPFDLKQALPVFGGAEGETMTPCNECPKRSDKQKALFGDDDDMKGAQCLDQTCWDVKVAAHIQHSLDSGMAGIDTNEEWQGNERFLSRHDEKPKGVKPQKVIVVDGHQKGAIVELYPRPEGKAAPDKPKRVTDPNAPRKVSKQEQEDIDQMYTLLVGAMAPFEPHDAQTIFDTLRLAAGSVVLKMVARRTGIDIEPYQLRGSFKMPSNSAERHTLVWTLLLTELCQHYGDARDALKNLMAVAKRYEVGGETMAAMQNIYDTWLTAKGGARPNGKDRHKARTEGAAA